ncbi:MAG: restriction endonuclease [Candidatus Dormibacteria bacterium]
MLQAFAGSLEGARARKGVIITTSSFTAEATAYVNQIEKRIVLIDGVTLAELMIEHGVGVATDRTYVVPRSCCHCSVPWPTARRTGAATCYRSSPTSSA